MADFISVESASGEIAPVIDSGGMPVFGCLAWTEAGIETDITKPREVISIDDLPHTVATGAIVELAANAEE